MTRRSSETGQAPLRGGYLDLASWGRRAPFEFFADYELPFFNVCSEVRVGPTLRYCRERGLSSSLACWFACLRTINALEPFRMRLRPPVEGTAVVEVDEFGVPVDASGHAGGLRATPRVWVHETIDIGTTVLNDDGETFRFCYFPYAERFEQFCAGARSAMERSRQGEMQERKDDDALVHGTTVPWVRFTSVSHPRRFGGLDSVPKIVFGRYDHRDAPRLVNANQTGGGLALFELRQERVEENVWHRQP